MALRCAVLTISDRSYSGQREDASGPVLVDKVREAGWEVVEKRVVPDNYDAIRNILIEWCDPGTDGFNPHYRRDRLLRQRYYPGSHPIGHPTLCARPGRSHAPRRAWLKTPHAMLSRGVAGIRSRTLIINLPGSPKAASENLEVVIPVISPCCGTAARGS